MAHDSNKYKVALSFPINTFHITIFCGISIHILWQMLLMEESALIF